MRRAAFLAFASMFFAQPLAAQDAGRASQALELSATAPPACVIKAARALATNNSSFQANGASGGTVTITRLVDPDTAEPRAATMELVIGATCNSSHLVSAISGRGGLRRLGNSSGPGNGFAEYLPYALRLVWAGSARDQASNAGPLALAVGNGATGDILLRIATPSGGTPLVAGEYDDSIVIQLQPAS